MAYGTYVDAAGVSHDLLVEPLDPAVELSDFLHSREFWRGKLAPQTATKWMDSTLAPFRAISGAGVYGADVSDEAQVVGSADTPLTVGQLFFAVDKVLLLATSVATIYKLRIVYGTGTMAAAITAGQFSEVMATALSAAGLAMPVWVAMPLVPVGWKVWVQAWNATDDAWADFLVGIHEYRA